eukprot:3109854-Pyramimonas_sp.AAC.1
MGIAAAFPSFLRAWMCNVLQRRGIHGRLLALMQAFYRASTALLEMGGTRRPFFLAPSGVAQ